MENARVELPGPLLSTIFSHLPQEENKKIYFICKAWRAALPEGVAQRQLREMGTSLEQMKGQYFPGLTWQEYKNLLDKTFEPLDHYDVNRKVFLGEKKVPTDFEIKYNLFFLSIASTTIFCQVLALRKHLSWKKLSLSSLGIALACFGLANFFKARDRKRIINCYYAQELVRLFCTPANSYFPVSEELKMAFEWGIFPRELGEDFLTLRLLHDRIEERAREQKIEQQIKRDKGEINAHVYGVRCAAIDHKKQQFQSNTQRSYHRRRVVWLYSVYVKQHPHAPLPDYASFQRVNESLRGYHSPYLIKYKQELHRD